MPRISPKRLEMYQDAIQLIYDLSLDWEYRDGCDFCDVGDKRNCDRKSCPFLRCHNFAVQYKLPE